MNERQRAIQEHVQSLGYTPQQDIAEGVAVYQHTNGLQVVLLTHPEVGVACLVPVGQALGISSLEEALSRFTERPDLLQDTLDLLQEAAFQVVDQSDSERARDLHGRIQEILRPFGRAEELAGPEKEKEERQGSWTLPDSELTLDTPVYIWWLAENQEEAERWTEGLKALGITQTDYTIPPDFCFWTTVRGALEGGMDVESLVDGYLRDGSEEHVRKLIAEGGVENLNRWAALNPRTDKED